MQNALFYFSLLVFASAHSLYAQNTCCSASTVAPEITTGVHTTVIPLNQNTPMAVLNVNASSDLPNVEYILTKRNTSAIDQNGMPTGEDVIIGSSVDGVVLPMNATKHGVTLGAGDTCDVTAIGYDLAIIQTLTDSLLNGVSGAQPCCNLFVLLGQALGSPSLGTFCSTLNTAGITSGADVMNMSDVLTVFDAMSTTGQTSIASMLSTLQLINGNGTFISSDCGGTGANNFLPYGINPMSKYAYVVGASTASGYTCCLSTTVAPEVTTGVHSTLVASNQATTAPTLAVNASADLPNVEYILTKRNTSAIDQNGMPTGEDVIIGASANGVFTPMNVTKHGVTLGAGDTCDVTAIGYNLATIQTLTDSLLNGSLATGQPCCNLFVLLGQALGTPSIGAFCSTLNAAGITSGADVNNMNDVLTVFDAMSTTGQTSIASMVSTLQLINGNGTLISSDCGGAGVNNFLSYGINPMSKYAYVIDNALTVQELNDIARFVMYPNPASNYVQMHFTTDKAIDLSVNVYDVLGQQVIHKNLGSVNGDYTTTLSIDKLTTGVYSVELTDGNDRKTYKLTVK